MSSTTSSPTSTATSVSASTTAATNDVSSSSSFYKNLFYILIGLLVIFALVSFLSLLKARRRRRAIIEEAERLGVMVPGIPGYVPLRDRHGYQWLRSNGKQSPEWWDISGDPDKLDEGTVSKAGSRMGSSHPSMASLQVPGEGARSRHRASGGRLNDPSDFTPVALVPPPPPSEPLGPVPQSSVPHFPNHLAYRPSSILPPKARFDNITPGELGKLEGLVGEGVEVVGIVRMPVPPWVCQRRGSDDEEDGQEILREWGGVELGVARMQVKR
ncbi:hypothetical protein, variant 1 [Cryptococcus amylolentus CBS 6039]|uniref:Uncharacterized protein n=3 Tax=Cryptococcus amylolentus TaxID=104669 RepID=A0A1E3HZD6_9TREE|nr:hypothetical protein, variant 1 [Cryptococcus amylolentus CBS 6039]ODN80941.1 hypothetical protein, variant 1 [Cryptococcus amylolentus CBS 6039]ODO09428.1 hypothetical protein I350_03028 [Cryptococcus amylolentus CBS 6273]